MKKIFYALFFSVLLLGVNPVLACSDEKSGIETGGACSISQLNNLENEKKMQDKNPKVRDLRPVNLTPKSLNENELNSDCLLGTCLIKKLLGE